MTQLNSLLQALTKNRLVEGSTTEYTGDAIDGRILVNNVEDVKTINFCYVGMLFSTKDDEESVYKVTEVDLESTNPYSPAKKWVKIGSLNKKIKIAGSAINAEGIWENDEIPEGTSVEEILQKLLCKELFPESPMLPSITATIVGTPLDNVMKVGSKITVNAFSALTTNGYFVANYTNVSQPSTGTKWSNIKYSCEKTGFDGYIVLQSVSKADEQKNISICLGNNTVVSTVTGDYSKPTVSPLTNLNNPTTNSQYTYPNGNDSDDIAISITGVYPIYHNSSSVLTDIDEEKIEVVKDSKTFEISYKSEMESEHFITFACPTSHTLVKAEIFNSLSSKYDELNLQNFFIREDSNITFNDKEYSVYKRINDISQNKIGASKFRFTLNKKTSEE